MSASSKSSVSILFDVVCHVESLACLTLCEWKCQQLLFYGCVVDDAVKERDVAPGVLYCQRSVVSTYDVESCGTVRGSTQGHVPYFHWWGHVHFFTGGDMSLFSLVLTWHMMSELVFDFS